MVNILRKKEDVARPVARIADWEPIHMMRDILGWDPFREMEAIAPAIEGYAPEFEVKETPEAYIFKADVPGIVEKDLEVTLTANRLTIAGKREAEEKKEGETFFVYERSYGKFVRTFTLPEGVDAEKLAAELKEGVLVVTLPKLPEAKPQKIEVKKGL